MADFANQVLEFVQAVRREWQSQPIATDGHTPISPGFKPRYLSYVKGVNADRSLTLMLLVYLPVQAPEPALDPSSASRSKPTAKPASNLAQVQVEVAVEQGPWLALQAPTGEDQPCWHLELSNVAPQSQIRFRYRSGSADWQPIVPLSTLDSVYGSSYAPRLAPPWQHEPPPYTHAKVLLETTLEGLLAGYREGKFAPKDNQELFYDSIADRILKTDIPGKLSEWAIDEVMVPVCSSVANRAYLDPKFNYLTYNFVHLDWQIGDAVSFQRLVDQFYSYGINIIPDLIFAHQVRNPFPGSLDQQRSPLTGQAFFVDEEAFLFRDYGTWMFDLSTPEVRRILIEKLLFFVKRFRLKTIRIDYVDGLILQYCNRDENYAEQFIRELKAALRQECPDVLALGETFEVAGNEAVKDFIDVFYAPIGFTLVEELYKPPTKMDRPLYPDVHLIVNHAEDVLKSPRREAYYAQLHDETWYCQHIVQGRPYVPWAYGGHPAQLAKNQGEELMAMGLLEPSHLLDYVRRTVRNAEALTMFLASLRYMFVPGVDSLSLGCLDDPEQWKFIWQGIDRDHVKEWEKLTGLSRASIIQTHEQHRSDMVQLRHIFRRFTHINGETYEPLVKPVINHFDPDASLLSLLRPNPQFLQDTLLIVFNFGDKTFDQSALYEIPIPPEFQGPWQVLFDGESHELPPTYPEGQILSLTQGQYSNQEKVLQVRIAARSLMVFKYQGTPS
jgi:1,4-alpha-glucan branching enzyme